MIVSAEKSLRRAKLQRRFKKVVIVKRTVDKSLCLTYKAVNIFDIFGIFETVFRELRKCGLILKNKKTAAGIDIFCAAAIKGISRMLKP